MENGQDKIWYKALEHQETRRRGGIEPSRETNPNRRKNLYWCDSSWLLNDLRPMTSTRHDKRFQKEHQETRRRGNTTRLPDKAKTYLNNCVFVADLLLKNETWQKLLKTGRRGGIQLSRETNLNKLKRSTKVSVCFEYVPWLGGVPPSAGAPKRY